MFKNIFSALFNTTPLVPRKTRLTVLVVVDGWGVAPPSQGNAIASAKIPNMKSFLINYPNTTLIASGESVGLPANVVGNSEVGHLTIGVGRVIDESLVRINRSIDNGDFFSNEALLKAATHVRNTNGTFHIAGMVSSGNVHSSMKHLYALIDFCTRQKLPDVALHLFTDGRDAAPMDGVNVLTELENALVATPHIKIATVCGRYYAMDRDARWERTGAMYNAMTLGSQNTFPSASTAVSSFYSQAITDEFVPPTSIVPSGMSPRLVKDHDSLVFFNFRVDRARQLSMSFILPDFENLKGYEWGFELDQGNTKSKISTGSTFKRTKVASDVFSVTMTEYQKQLPASAIAFPHTTVQKSVSEVIAGAGYSQLHLAESEKERMVTYYFDGLRTDRFTGEDVLIIPSPRVATYDKKPEMSVREIAKQSVRAIKRGSYDFIVMNMANPDMVAHTGNLQATIKGVEEVDTALGLILAAVLEANGTMLITADHGNAEELITYNQSGFYFTSDSGSMNTEHSNNPVPFIIMNKELFQAGVQMQKGNLSDVAPTILALMNLQVPEEMTGVNLLKKENKTTAI